MQIFSLISVRLRLALTLILLSILIGVAAFIAVDSAQTARDDALEVNAIGLLRTRSVEASLIAEEITLVGLDNQSVLTSLQQELNENAAELTNLQDLYRASQNVEPEEFRAFVGDVQNRHPEIAYIGFATDEDESYRLDISAPANNSVLEDGYDFASNPAFLETIDRAIALRETAISAPVTGFLAEENQSMVVLFLPLFESENSFNLIGIFSLGISIDEFMTHSLEEVEGTGQVIAIRDAETVAYTNNNLVGLSGFSIIETTLTIFGRTWTLEIRELANTVELEASLRDLANDLSDRISAAEAGSDVYNLPGLERHTEVGIQNAYDELVANNITLQSSITTFLQTSSPLERETLITTLRDDAFRVRNSADQLVAALETELEGQTTATITQTTILAFISAILVIIGLLVIYDVIRNLARVDAVANQLASGDLTARSTVVSGDEIGKIGQALNFMAQELQNIVGLLESRVNERTRDLATILEVSNRASTTLSVDRLLEDVADLTKERFNLYHAHIYLYEADNDQLVLTAGAGYVGRQMVAENRRISFANPDSIVAEAARSRETIIINDTRASEVFLPHPLLPDTAAELAVALVARGQLLGVLDVQSNKKEFFTEQTRNVLETLAIQISNALNNAQLFEVADRTSRHEQALGAITQNLQSAENIEEALQITVKELGKALRVPHTAIELHLKTNGDQ